jgi:hypothetical protein
MRQKNRSVLLTNFGLMPQVLVPLQLCGLRGAPGQAAATNAYVANNVTAVAASNANAAEELGRIDNQLWAGAAGLGAPLAVWSTGASGQVAATNANANAEEEQHPIVQAGAEGLD